MPFSSAIFPHYPNHFIHVQSTANEAHIPVGTADGYLDQNFWFVFELHYTVNVVVDISLHLLLFCPGEKNKWRGR